MGFVSTLLTTYKALDVQALLLGSRPYKPMFTVIGGSQKVFAKHGPQISLSLLCKSLPEAYACANGAKVLYATGRMTERNGSLDVFTRRYQL